MKTNKTSKSTAKIIESSAASPKEQIITDSKPVTRTTTSSTAAKTTGPKTASHRHSKTTPYANPAAEAVTAKVAPTTPTSEDVARLAHAFWVERNFAHGFAAEDWFRAEKALTTAQ